MIILAIIGGIVGARIYYVAFRPEIYFGEGNWANIFRIQEGGLAIYGGIFGAVAAFLIYCHFKKLPITRLLDPGAFGLFIAQSLGRWGNFFNREAFGVETTMPWAMGLHTAEGTIYVHPAFLYESLWNICGLILLHTFSKKVGRKYYGHYALIYIAWYGLGRFFIEGLRVDSLFFPGTDIRVSQMVALISFVVALIALIYNRVRGLNNIQTSVISDTEDLLVANTGETVSDNNENAEIVEETIVTEEIVDNEEPENPEEIEEPVTTEETEEVEETEKSENTEKNDEIERKDE
jgi:phosphatidylglycerol:prolipoprotein diacylglycerol transferase